MANERTRSLLRSRGIQVTIAVVVVIIVAIVYYAGRTKAPTYFTAAVKTGNITSVVQATGVVNPQNTIAIGSQVSGKITQILVDFNSKVKKGQLLAQIDPSVYQTSVNSAKADLANAEASLKSAEAQVAVQTANVQNGEANVEKAQASLTQAKLQRDRTLNLFKQGIVSASQRDQDVATYETDVASLDGANAGLAQNKASLVAAKASVAQAQATIKSRQAALNNAETNLGYCNIYAPYDGTIINRAVNLGQTVAASFSTPNMFTEATDLSTMWVYVQTDESDVGRLKDGDDATFTVDAFPNVTYHGIVKQRRMNATTVQNVVEYDTIIEFQNTDEKLFPGMTAYVNIPVARARNVLMVPNSAMRFKPDMTPVELRETLAKYGINGDQAAGPGGGNGARQGGGQRRQGGGGAPGGGGAAAGGPGGGGRGGFGGGGRGRGQGAAGAEADANRPTVSVIWKLDADKNLIPVRVMTGITDFTNTAVTRVLQGTLKDGDQVVTGSLVVNSGPSGLNAATRGGRR